MQRAMGDHKPGTVVRTGRLGAASSSCSYAATALAKSLFQRGADFTSAMVFMVASTNLVIELGVVLWLLIWQMLRGPAPGCCSAHCTGESWFRGGRALASRTWSPSHYQGIEMPAAGVQRPPRPAQPSDASRRRLGSGVVGAPGRFDPTALPKLREDVARGWFGFLTELPCLSGAVAVAALSGS